MFIMNKRSEVFTSKTSNFYVVCHEIYFIRLNYDSKTIIFPIFVKPNSKHYLQIISGTGTSPTHVYSSLMYELY